MAPPPRGERRDAVRVARPRFVRAAALFAAGCSSATPTGPRIEPRTGVYSLSPTAQSSSCIAVQVDEALEFLRGSPLHLDCSAGRCLAGFSAPSAEATVVDAELTVELSRAVQLGVERYTLVIRFDTMSTFSGACTVRRIHLGAGPCTMRLSLEGDRIR